MNGGWEKEGREDRRRNIQDKGFLGWIYVLCENEIQTERNKGKWKKEGLKDRASSGAERMGQEITEIARKSARVWQMWPLTMRELPQSRFWGGTSGVRGGWISFLWGSDLQSGSGTGTPFNQRYSNWIGWPLQRVSLGDFTRPTRLQGFEVIIESRNSSIGAEGGGAGD